MPIFLLINIYLIKYYALYLLFKIKTYKIQIWYNSFKNSLVIVLVFLDNYYNIKRWLGGKAIHQEFNQERVSETTWRKEF